MDVRYSISPIECKNMDTQQLRNNILNEELFVVDEIKMTYTAYNRMISGGCMPVNLELIIENSEETRTDYFMQMREMGIINIGGKGTVKVDGTAYSMEMDEILYVAKGSRKIIFEKSKVAKYYFVSVPAHKSYKTKLVSRDMAKKVEVEMSYKSSKRTVFRYIHGDVLKSCQLIMGMTVVEPCNDWDAMRRHTHLTRVGTYLYCKIPEDNVVMHIMGQGDQTRHIILRNEQAFFCPSWSVHSSVGTASYAYVWGMVEENKPFTNMQGVEIKDIKKY